LFGVRVYLNTDMPRTRTPSADMLALARADLVGALDAIGVHVAEEQGRWVRLTTDGVQVELAVLTVAYATRTRIGEVLERSASPPRPTVLVADRITSDARRLLTDAGWGWLDRRGHLRIQAPGVLIDIDLDLPQRDGPGPDEPIRGRAGLAVAYRLLTVNRDVPVSPRRSSLSFAPSTISEALSRLRSAGLIDSDGAPLLPELFWVVADHWKRERTWLATEPVIEDVTNNELDEDGWCISGTVAAVELGAPVVSLVGAAPDLYVPDPATVRIAARRYGVVADPYAARASIAVAPVPDVTACRQLPASQGWPVAHPVAVALDLAQDRARGREIIDDWWPPERVW